MYTFGERSKLNLSYCHPDLIKIHLEAIKRSRIDYGISHGHRTPEQQFELYKKGRESVGEVWQVVNKKEVVTNCDGYHKKSKHNQYPSIATDIYIYVKGKPELTFDEKHLIYVISHLITTAQYLYENGEIEHVLRWGGNWDVDGEIVYDQNLIDLPHVELIKP
jgi:peptidoglycan L-alanyl-D-glutamate endopeptidase CwlK